MECVSPSLQLLDPEHARTRERKVKRAVERGAAQERKIRCAACRQIVTHQDYRIAAGGASTPLCQSPRFNLRYQLFFSRTWLPPRRRGDHGIHLVPRAHMAHARIAPAAKRI